MDYAISGQDPQLLCTSVEDLPIPEFDNIGMEAVPATTLFNSNRFNGTNINDFLGYNPRYWPWKSKIDRIHGAFTTTLKDWVVPVDDSFLYSTFNTTPAMYRDWETDRKSTRLNSSHITRYRMPSSA